MNGNLVIIMIRYSSADCFELFQKGSPNLNATLWVLSKEREERRREGTVDRI